MRKPFEEQNIMAEKSEALSWLVSRWCAHCSPKHTPWCAEHQEDSLALYYVQHDVLFGSISRDSLMEFHSGTLQLNRHFLNWCERRIDQRGDRESKRYLRRYMFKNIWQCAKKIMLFLFILCVIELTQILQPWKAANLSKNVSARDNGFFWVAQLFCSSHF